MSIRSKIITAAAVLTMVAGLATSAVAYTGIPAGFSFNRNLPVGTVNQDVVYLKAVLTAEGFGVGITNTTYYGPNTKANVQAFQAKYRTQISAFAGYTIAATGLVGTGTRAQLNVLIGGDTPPPTTAGGLSVGLAGDTPASTSIADAGNAYFTKVNLTAGTAGAVSISRLYVKRTGLSANADVENIKFVDAVTGTYKGSIGSLNVDSRALITFTPSLIIPAGTTRSFYIRAGIVDTTDAGKTVSLGIAAAADITSNATSVTGSFPIIGNPMSVVNLAIGTVTATLDGTTVDSKPDAGSTNVIANNFKISAGSTEGFVIDSISAIKAGTNEASGTENIELYDVTHGRSLGTVVNWDSEEKVTWSGLNLAVAKGETVRLKVMLDVVKGVSSTNKTINVDIVDGSDVLIVARGDVYGFQITPVTSGSWDGLGSNVQTINKGALNISKSASSPATGKVAAGDVTLGVFDFDARGEAINITQIIVEATLGGTMTYDEVTNVKIYDENGVIVTGPKDLASTSNVTFTDTFIAPVGVHKYTVKAKLATTVAASDTILVDIATPTVSITAKGMTSNDTIAPTPAADVSANTQTVAGAVLTIETLTTPAARSVARGVNDFIFATFALNAANAGEDIQVSVIEVLDTTGTNGDLDDIDNMELWADLTSANSSRGDVYETRISNSENPSDNDADDDAEQSFTLTQTITVPKGSFVKVALIADINASASTTTDTHAFNIDGTTATVTANGALTGSTATKTYSPTTAQTMTISGGGALTISKDSSSPAVDIVLGGSTSTLAVFRLAADNIENLDVDDITLTVSGGTSVDTYYFYNGTSLLGSTAGGNDPKLVLADGTLTVPANGNVKVTVKGAMATVDESVVTSNSAVTAKLLIADAVNTTGSASGGEVDSNAGTATGSTMDLYKTRPYFSLAAGSPTGTLAVSSQTQLAIFDVRAAAGEDVTFQNGDSNYLIVKISASQTDSDGTANTFTLKDGDGNTLDSASAADGATSVTFWFGTTDFTVPAGETKKLIVSGNTLDFQSPGDTIQLWLDDAATNIGWGINNLSTIYYDGDKIFRGDIMGGTLVKPPI